MMVWIEGSETSDKGFSLIGNRAPVRTMEFGFGVSVLLGKGGDVIGTKWGWLQRRGERR